MSNDTRSVVYVLFRNEGNWHRIVRVRKTYLHASCPSATERPSPVHRPRSRSSCTYGAEIVSVSVKVAAECPCGLINGCCYSSACLKSMPLLICTFAIHFEGPSDKMLATTTCEIGSGSEDLMIFTKNGETHRWVFQEAVNLRGKCMELWRLHYLL